MENNFENAKTFIKDRMPKHLYGGDARQLEIARCMIDYANAVLPQADVSGWFFADEFDEWIELYDWEFNPVSFNGGIKYRWVNKTYSGQATTKELYELFLSQK